MIEVTFKTELSKIKTDKILIEKLWKEINTRYNKRNRYYHNITHLDNLIKELTIIKDKINDWQTIVFSVAYHDIVYNILKMDNEEKSGDLAFKRLTLLELPEYKKDNCRKQILATKGHHKSSDSDTNLFTDADLSILGSEYIYYKAYTEQIRKEYQFYPDLLYKPGRKKVLKHFLEMKAIYKSPYFAEKYEQRARENIILELEELEL